MKACIIGMAKREPNHIDGRNRAAYEMCRMLAPMLETPPYLSFESMKSKNEPESGLQN